MARSQQDADNRPGNSDIGVRESEPPPSHGYIVPLIITPEPLVNARSCKSAPRKNVPYEEPAFLPASPLLRLFRVWINISGGTNRFDHDITRLNFRRRYFP